LKAVNKILAASILMGLVGCANVQPSQFVGPNGKTAYSMKCSGMGRTMQECYQVVGSLCPSGYNIIDNSSSMVAAASNNQLFAAAKREMAVECK
jgi:hypothetical protein